MGYKMVQKLVFGFVLLFVVAAGFGVTSAQRGQEADQSLLGYYQKDQCKKGGWKDLGFRNQGQCVSFFASEGRAPGFQAE